MTRARGTQPGAMAREIVAAVPAVTYRATSDTDTWTFTSVQGGLLERLGTRPEDLCGDPSRWVLMIHRADRERVIAERRRAARSGHLELEYRLQTPDGGDCWVHDVAVRDDRSDGAMCGIVTDLTAHCRADDILEQLHDARLRAVTALLRRAAVRDTTVQLFVHDMRSPLTAVAGLARTLQERGGDLPPMDRDRVFGRMVAAGDRVVALVDDFARFWDLPLHDAALPTSRLALATLVADAIHEVDVDHGQIEVDADDVVVETNAELLRRVLVGLLRNAMQHTPEGTGIRVAAEAGDGRVVLEVEDDGPGIPEYVRHRVFEDHTRVSGDGPGLGVGLNLVCAAVELLGGDIRALEGATGGTLIRVELPDASESEHGESRSDAGRGVMPLGNPVASVTSGTLDESGGVGTGGEDRMTGDANGGLARLRETLTLLQSHVATTLDDAMGGQVIDALAGALRELESSVAELHTLNDELLDARAQLHDERQRYVDLFQQAPEPYVVTDTEGVIEEANAATCELLGEPLDRVQGRLLAVFLRPEDRGAITHLIETLGDGATSTELVVTPTNDAAVVVSAVVVPRRSPGARFTELRWILHDVTDARRSQATLEAAFTRTREEAVELRDLDRWKNAFLAAAAHDLRAPLAGITAAVQTLLATHELGDATSLVSNIATQANRVARLLDDLLDLDRFTRGTVTAERAPTHLPKLVEDALVLAGTDRREVQVEVPSIVVNLDRVLACQIISNLIVNAAAHTPPGTPVAVKVADRGNHIEIVVEDHGPGIPPELWEEVFRPFVTRRAHQADECGPGLGLSLVRLFAELHGGTAHMEGSPGGGARVVVRLPGRVAARPGGSSPGPG